MLPMPMQVPQSATKREISDQRYLHLTDCARKSKSFFLWNCLANYNGRKKKTGNSRRQRGNEHNGWWPVRK
jgi:hypothetical protein